MAKLPYVNKNSYDHASRKYEINLDPSLTEPDQIMSIKDLVKRAKAGIEPHEDEALYFSPTNIQEIDRFYGQPLDLTDLDDVRKRTANLVANIDEAIQKHNTDEESSDEPIEKLGAPNSGDEVEGPSEGDSTGDPS